MHSLISQGVQQDHINDKLVAMVQIDNCPYSNLDLLRPDPPIPEPPTSTSAPTFDNERGILGAYEDWMVTKNKGIVKYYEHWLQQFKAIIGHCPS